jgi:hypothetical protein
LSSQPSVCMVTRIVFIYRWQKSKWENEGRRWYTAYFRRTLSYFVINYVRLNYIDITKHTYFLNLNDYGNNDEIILKNEKCLYIYLLQNT